MERLVFYLGDIVAKPNAERNLNAYAHPGPSDTWCSGKVITTSELEAAILALKHVPDAYSTPIYEEALLARLAKLRLLNKPFMLQRGDNCFRCTAPALAKCRLLTDGPVLVRCMEVERHWRPFYNPIRGRPWDARASAAVWRGSSTGGLGDLVAQRPATRFRLVERWGKARSNAVDVGFSGLSPETERGTQPERWSQYVKAKLSRRQMQDFRYIISVEGNDKDSGLNWKLGSGRVVMMAKPTATSWLMETRLVPGVHYVLLKDDFSDLEERVQWCEAHPLDAKRIAGNAIAFMRQFADERAELMLEGAVLRHYFKRTYAGPVTNSLT